jgi:hypothetical protein
MAWVILLLTHVYTWCAGERWPLRHDSGTHATCPVTAAAVPHLLVVPCMPPAHPAGRMPQQPQQRWGGAQAPGAGHLQQKPQLVAAAPRQ